MGDRLRQGEEIIPNCTNGIGTSRPRPRVRKKKNRSSQNDLEVVDACISEDITEEVAMHEVTTNELQGEELIGPKDRSVLSCFDKHVAASIWKGEERGPLKCIHHAHKVMVNDWKVSGSLTKKTKFKNLLAQSGLLPLVGLSYKFVDRILVSAFVERWHPETNTFHMPVGEMTITLDDVAANLGIPVTGKAIDCKKLNNQDAEKLLVRALGVTSEEAHKELTKVRGQTIGLTWLKNKFSKVTNMHSSDHDIECATRAYLLYLLGCTLFADKTGSRVSVMYLNLLMDLSTVHDYAWGAGALAFLYRQLGSASESEGRQMAGYLTLLEAWIYEHFPSVSTAHRNLKYKQDQPRAKRWEPRGDCGFTIQHLQVQRELIDTLRPEDVTWNPCRDDRGHHPFQEVAWYTGCLQCVDIIEPYHPNRVLRQFGRKQTIPLLLPPQPRPTRGAEANKHRDQTWGCWENHVLSQLNRGVSACLPSDCESNYMEWYSSISHLVLQNPSNRSFFHPCVPPSNGSSSIDLAQRISTALGISRPIIERGREESTVSAVMLYDALNEVTKVLEGQSIVTASDLQYRNVYKRKRRK